MSGRLAFGIKRGSVGFPSITPKPFSLLLVGMPQVCGKAQSSCTQMILCVGMSAAAAEQDAGRDGLTALASGSIHAKKFGVQQA